MADASPEALLLAEHSHDASHDLSGDGWHGVMNYAGFTRPVWQWLKGSSEVPFEPGPFAAIPSLSGCDIVASMREFSAAAPWRATSYALTLVGSHDTMRISTMLGDPQLVSVALGLLATMPGIPMLWAGDEIGQEGMNGEDGRRPFPWTDMGQWDSQRLATVQALLNARKQSRALRQGGLRWLSVEDDAFTFLREAPGESVLIHAARTNHAPVELPPEIAGTHLHGLAGTKDVLAGPNGLLKLPHNGPAFAVWRCGPLKLDAE